MTKSLPANPNITALKKEAKRLLKDFRSSLDGTSASTSRAIIQQFHPKPDTFKGLRDAQFTIARQYGYKDWEDLKNGVEIQLIKSQSPEERVDRFIRLACLTYQDDHVNNYRRANQLLSADQTLSQQSFYSALVAYDVEAVKQYIAKNPSIISQTGGPFNWPPLHYLTFSRIDDSENGPRSVELVKLLLDNGANPNAYIQMWDTRWTALTGAVGEGEGGPVHQPAHTHARAIAKLLLEAGADGNDSQSLYNSMFEENSLPWVKLLMNYGLSAKSKVNWDQSSNAQPCFDYLLAQAVKNGQLERVIFYLDNGADPNTEDVYAKRRIYPLAMIGGYAEIAELLLKHGADKEDLEDKDWFKHAISSKDYSAIEQLLKKAPEYTKDPDFLHHAASKADFEMVTYLLNAGFDINGLTENGRCIMHIYAWEDDLVAVRALIDKGARTDIRDTSYQSTPLGHAIFNDAKNVAHYLLDITTDILEPVWCARADRVKQLIDEDPARLETLTAMGNTLMHVVGFFLREEEEEQACADILDLLLEKGMDVNSPGQEGMTPLDFSMEKGWDMMVDLLLERGGRRSSVKS